MMKTNLRSNFIFVAASLIALIVIAVSDSTAATYFISSSEGSDEWTGQAETHRGTNGPWKTLARASMNYQPGDSILLKRGDTWNDELRPKGNGTPDKPITISSYGKGNKPIIDRVDYKQDLVGIRLIDQEGFKIVGIEFAHCMTGIYAEYSDEISTKKFIWIEDCYFRDSLHYQHYEDYPKRKIGLGICFFSYERENKIVLTDITIKNCVFRRLASGVWTNSPDNFNKNASYIYNFANMTFEDCLFEEGYQWQMGIRGVAGGLVRRCVTLDVGRNFRSFNGVAGAMFFRCKDWVFEDSEWGFVSIGLGSGDGQAFDFEGNCDNMIMRNCLFHDTDGPGFLLCCYASDGHAHTKILMENCLINGKSKRPIGLPRCAIVNTTDWNEVTWKNCRFYLSTGEALMRVMDPEKDKRSLFVDCLVKKLSDACSTDNLSLKAKFTASSQALNSDAIKAKDGKADTAWKAKDENESWLQLEFAVPTVVNEFRIKEDSSSSISRYAIEAWDEQASRWASCFNGMNIGAEFVAPIISRKAKKFRLVVIRTDKGEPAITEFEAYNDTTTMFVHDKLGNVTQVQRLTVDLAPSPTPAPTPVPVPMPTPTQPPVGNAAKSNSDTPQTVLIGTPGNKADTTGFGAVAYEYKIGKYEVTNTEFCEFLNGVAKADNYGLYDSRMADEYGGINRSGQSGNYTYDLKKGMEKKPVSYVTWETTIRYANWLTNGRGESDTEKGAYTIENGQVTLPDHAKLAAAKTTTWALADENEWYKAAYYDADKADGGEYAKYPLKGERAPKANLNTNAPSDAGSFDASPTGTYDQGGNVWEYVESRNGNKVGLRGGSFYHNDNEGYMRSATRYDVLSAKWPNYGFRVVALGDSKKKER